ncbi:hypothetical protein Fcan01_22154, partial [Folsomia candida]
MLLVLAKLLNLSLFNPTSQKTCTLTRHHYKEFLHIIILPSRITKQNMETIPKVETQLRKFGERPSLYNAGQNMEPTIKDESNSKLLKVGEIPCSSDSSDEELILLSSVTLILQQSKNTVRRIPKYRVNPYLQLRHSKGRFVKDFDDLVQHPPAFKENYHMNQQNFDEILTAIENDLNPKFRARPDSISAKEKLSVSLEYLASGSMQRHIANDAFPLQPHILKPFAPRNKEALTNEEAEFNY